jgi:hypothetical protein
MHTLVVLLPAFLACTLSALRDTANAIVLTVEERERLGLEVVDVVGNLEPTFQALAAAYEGLKRCLKPHRA